MAFHFEYNFFTEPFSVNLIFSSFRKKKSHLPARLLVWWCGKGFPAQHNCPRGQKRCKSNDVPLTCTVVKVTTFISYTVPKIAVEGLGFNHTLRTSLISPEKATSRTYPGQNRTITCVPDWLEKRSIYHKQRPTHCAKPWMESALV